MIMEDNVRAWFGDATMNGASEISGRVVRKEVKVNAPVEKVWDARQVHKAK